MSHLHQQHRSKWKPFQLLVAGLALACSAQATASVTNPVIGQLLWSEEFNGTSLNTGVWNLQDGNGCQINLCGYGNAELQYYSPNNVTIANVPFESGTRALAIQARSQTVGSNLFTSGKIDTRARCRCSTAWSRCAWPRPRWAPACGRPPGCWASARRPGRATARSTSWRWGTRPRCGPGRPPSSNNFVGANVITCQQAACVPGNESCAASTAWQTKNWYTPPRSLANRFVTYRLYWTDTQMRFSGRRQRRRARHVQRAAAGQFDRAAGAVLPAAEPGRGRQLHRCGQRRRR